MTFEVETIFQVKDKVVVMGLVLSDQISINDSFSYITNDGTIKESLVLGVEKFREVGLTHVYKNDNVGLSIKGDKLDFYDGQKFYKLKKTELESHIKTNGIESLTKDVSSKKEIIPLTKMNEELKVFISENVELVRLSFKKILQDYEYNKRIGIGYYSVSSSTIERGLNIGYSDGFKIKYSIESLELVIQAPDTGELTLLQYEEFDDQLKKFHVDMTEDEAISILKKLKDKVDLGIISPLEFDSKKTELLPYMKNT
jgi:hypothetical protein